MTCIILIILAVFACLVLSPIILAGVLLLRIFLKALFTVKAPEITLDLSHTP